MPSPLTMISFSLFLLTTDKHKVFLSYQFFSAFYSHFYTSFFLDTHNLNNRMDLEPASAIPTYV